MEFSNSIKTNEKEGVKRMSYEKKYEIPDSYIIGQGHFGQVKRAIVKETMETVCVKVLSKKLAFGVYEKTNVSGSDIANCQYMIDKKHKNLVEIFDVYDDNKEQLSYIFMELCQGNLKEYTEKESKTLNQFDEISQLVRQIVSGYLQLRKYKIIHRDIKEDNILYQKSQNNEIVFKISDYGLSKQAILRDCEEKTKKVGAVQYMAPEVLGSDYNDRCDVYSFGIVIMNLVFSSKQIHISYKKIEEKTFSELMKEEIQNKKIDQRLIFLLDYMIVYNPKNRFDWSDLQILFQYFIKEVSTQNFIPLAVNLETKQDVSILIIAEEKLTQEQKQKLKSNSLININSGFIQNYIYIQEEQSSFLFIIMNLQFSKLIEERVKRQNFPPNQPQQQQPYVQEILEFFNNNNINTIFDPLRQTQFKPIIQFTNGFIVGRQKQGSTQSQDSFNNNQIFNYVNFTQPFENYNTTNTFKRNLNLQDNKESAQKQQFQPKPNFSKTQSFNYHSKCTPFPNSFQIQKQLFFKSSQTNNNQSDLSIFSNGKADQNVVNYNSCNQQQKKFPN